MTIALKFFDGFVGKPFHISVPRISHSASRNPISASVSTDYRPTYQVKKMGRAMTSILKMLAVISAIQGP
jgi:hypothetical protein